MYLEQQLPGWNVDCEYNRQGPEPGTQNNLLAIEMKKADYESDIPKACEYTASPQVDRSFQYQYGLVVSIVPVPQLTWFANGVEISLQGCESYGEP